MYGWSEATFVSLFLIPKAYITTSQIRQELSCTNRALLEIVSFFFERSDLCRFIPIYNAVARTRRPESDFCASNTTVYRYFFLHCPFFTTIKIYYEISLYIRILSVR